MIGPASLLLLAATAQPNVPEAAERLVAAARAGEVQSAQALLSAEAMVVDSRADGGATNLEAYAAYVRGCRVADRFVDVDQDDRRRAAVTVQWDCGERGRFEDFIWTDGDRVVFVQFGMGLAAQD